MSKVNDSEERLAELIWRTVKLRVSLLVLTILVLLVVWSAMASGKKQARINQCSSASAGAAPSVRNVSPDSRAAAYRPSASKYRK